MADKTVIKPEDMGSLDQVITVGIEPGATILLEDAARKTIAARLRQLGTALAAATDEQATAITTYMTEAREVAAGEDGAAMVAWCDENRQRFWELTGQA